MIYLSRSAINNIQNSKKCWQIFENKSFIVKDNLDWQLSETS